MAFDPDLSVFSFRPDWTDGVRERVEFYTDPINAAYDGTEQTRSLRLTPRRTFEFALGAEGVDRQLLGARAWHNGAARWYLPLWTDGQPLQTDVAILAATLALDTQDRDFVAGGLALLLGATARECEVVEIDTVAADALTLTVGTTRAWDAGTLVLPVRLAMPDSAFSSAAFTGAFGTGRVRFRVIEPNPWPAIAPATTYRGFPVLETRPHTARDPDTELTRRAETFDDSVVFPVQTDPPGMPFHRQVHDWWLDGRAAIAAFRSMAYALRGKRNSLWVPTWLDDLTIADTTAADATALQVARCGYSENIAGQTNRQDLRLELVDGTVLYRRVTESAPTSPDFEQLTLDSAPGVELSPANVAQISFLALCRSDSDAFEFDWWTGDFAEVATAWRGRQHDV